MRLVVTGATNREVAVTLSRSPKTVAGQLSSAMRKLGVASRTELAVRVTKDPSLVASCSDQLLGQGRAARPAGTGPFETPSRRAASSPSAGYAADGGFDLPISVKLACARAK